MSAGFWANIFFLHLLPELILAKFMIYGVWALARGRV